MADQDSGHGRVVYCDSCPQRATYVAFRDDLELDFCDHHTNVHVNRLVSEGFFLHLLPGARTPVG